MQYGVIMAGGAGTRLWPLSRGDTPKQLLSIVRGKSLLQLSYERLRGMLPAERIFVCTGAAHREKILANLPELPHANLLGEPTVRSVSAATYAELGPRNTGGMTQSDKQQVGSPFEVEDLATAFLRLEGGGTLLLESSWATYRSNGDDFGVTLYGSEGGAQINVHNYTTENTLRIYTDVAGVPAEVSPLVPRGEGHVAVVREFVDVIRSGDWAAHVGREGLRRAQIIDACYQSALEGREVVIDERMLVE